MRGMGEKRKPKRRQAAVNCESCANYVYEDDYECYICLVNLDEDEYGKFLTGSFRECPYYRLEDEYKVVRHQM